MTFPVLQGTAQGDTFFTTSHTINLPSSIAAGDLLLIFFNIDVGNATTPSGWTLLTSTVVGSNNVFYIYYKSASGSEGASISITTDTSTSASYISARVTGWSGTPEVSTAATGSTTTPDPGSLTLAGGAKDALWIACFGSVAASDTPITAPTNYSTAVVQSTGLATTVALATRNLNAASENPGTFSKSTGGAWGAFTVGISPVLVLISTALAGASSLLASVFASRAGSAAWPATATLIASATEIMLTRATLPASAALVASTTQKMLVSATLAGGGQTLALASLLLPTSAVLGGSGNLLVDSLGFKINNATLFASSSLRAAPLLFGQLAATLVSSADLLASATQRWAVGAVLPSGSTMLFTELDVRVVGRVGGSSDFYGPFAYLDDRPAPVRTLKPRKRITKPNLPPEAAIPAPVQEPPEYIKRPYRVAMPGMAPVKPPTSPIEQLMPQIKNEIRQASDESSDVEDAIMVLKALEII